MNYFNIHFEFVNGKTKDYIGYRAQNYNYVAGEVMGDNERWFGTKGDLVNLDNVITCEIYEVDENGYSKE
ncbi:hypothetical protein [Salinibacillus xinjiangensis]|uniref:Uncharacterized protein n=1 Tax=Salinibacillus xinjiangensis TaxID=1229268 RepID=A0A6G1X7L1_9BACI|nr:hypothetical protein [Salinibacillus xinjiangensis]MRG86991.1 hypothetical protein [Salinibacillus xinjiangensis]